MRRSHLLELLLVLALFVSLAFEIGPPPSVNPEPENWIVGHIPTDIPTLEKDLVRLRGLHFNRIVPAEMVDRDRLRKMFEQFQNEEDPDETDHEEASLRAFGLIPERFDLKPFLLDFHTSETAGVYVHKVRRFYVVKETRKHHYDPMTAVGTSWPEIICYHEVDHALQDQNFNLRKLESDDRHHVDEDHQMAHRALIEGDATWVMLAKMYDCMGVALTGLSDVGGLQERMANAETDTGHKAPLFFRRTMSFPYAYGFNFVHTLRRLAPDWDLVNKAWHDLPDSTQQIMHPALYYGERRFPIRVRWTHPPGVKLLDHGTIGEFVTGVLLDAHLGVDASHAAAAAHWRGDHFQVSGTVKAPRLAWLSVWDSSDAARAMQALLQKCFPTAEVVAQDDQVSVLHRFPADELAAWRDALRSATRTEMSHTVLVHLTPQEIHRRQAQAPGYAVNPLALVRNALHAAPAAKFEKADDGWACDLLGMTIKLPETWTVIPNPPNIIFRARQGLTAQIFIVQYSRSERLPNDKLAAAFARGVGQWLSGVKVGSVKTVKFASTDWCEIKITGMLRDEPYYLFNYTTVSDGFTIHCTFMTPRSSAAGFEANMRGVIKGIDLQQ